MRERFFGEGARLLRFALTGGIAGSLQLALLGLLTRHGVHDMPANSLAFLLAAQANFALSCTVTWGDRAVGVRLWWRWLAFHGAIVTTAIVKMLVFTGARMVIPTLAAAVLGIGVAALGNYLAGDRLVFRRQATPRPHARRGETAA